MLLSALKSTEKEPLVCELPSGSSRDSNPHAPRASAKALLLQGFPKLSRSVLPRLRCPSPEAQLPSSLHPVSVHMARHEQVNPRDALPQERAPRTSPKWSCRSSKPSSQTHAKLLTPCPCSTHGAACKSCESVNANAWLYPKRTVVAETTTAPSLARTVR